VLHALVSRIHLKTVAIVAAIAIPLATTSALALPAAANAQTVHNNPDGSTTIVPTSWQVHDNPDGSVTIINPNTTAPNPQTVTACANGLAALGYQPNPYASADQQQQTMRSYLGLLQRGVNEEIDGYFANRPAGSPHSFGALPFNMQQQANFVVAASQACGVPVTPPASLTPASASPN
jgi:hypothetical protein